MPSPPSILTPARLDQLKLWLVGVMLRRRDESAIPDPEFSAGEWEALAICAGQHRLRPLLYHRLQFSWSGWTMPSRLREQWQKAAKRAALRALDRQAVVVEVARTLERAKIPCAMLKGAALARHYGNPALRPMRDIDVLVAPDQAKRAFAQLLEIGFVRRAEIGEAAHIDYTTHKHLEPLWCPRRRIAVEVHTALVELPRGSASDDLLLQVGAMLAQRRIEQIGGHPVPVLDWAATMLHLIVHAVYDHQLNNGPLVLTDCAALARDEAADWPRFWHLASNSGRGNGAALIFAIIARYGGELPAEALQGPVPSQDPILLEQSALLMLQDIDLADAQGGWDRLFAQGSWRQQFALARQRIALRRQAARENAHHSGDSGNLALAWRMVQALSNPAQRREVARSRAVFGWLQRER